MKIRDIMSGDSDSPGGNGFCGGANAGTEQYWSLAGCGKRRPDVRLADRQGYCDTVPRGRAVAVHHAGEDDYDDGGRVRTAGYGFGIGGRPHGQQTDQKAAGDGEWEAVRNAESWGLGAERGEQH